MTVVVLMVRASQLSSAGGRGSRRRAEAIGVPESPVRVQFEVLLLSLVLVLIRLCR